MTNESIGDSAIIIEDQHNYYCKDLANDCHIGSMNRE